MHTRERLVSVLTCALVLVGCSRQEPAETTQENFPVSAEESAKIETQLIPPPSAGANATAQERLEGAIHPELTMRLQTYIERTGKVPETIYEFSNTAVDSMPPAPAGMKYTIDAADKTVKVVRK